MSTAWKANIANISEMDRLVFLASLGVDHTHIGTREYHFGQVRDAKEELARNLRELDKTFDELYKELKISTETHYQEAAA